MESWSSALSRVTSPKRGGLAGRRSNLCCVQVIVTHANTDFDAFAAMLAARRLYPDAVIALAEELLQADGGLLFDGYRLDAPPEWRQPFPRNEP